jgi:hypothetical protein
MRYFRELMASYVEEDSCVIGGHGVTIEIDENKISKRKNKVNMHSFTHYPCNSLENI